MKKIIIGLLAMGSISSFAGSLEEGLRNIQSRIPELTEVTYKEIKLMASGDSITTKEDFRVPTVNEYIIKKTVKCHDSRTDVSILNQQGANQGIINLASNQVKAIADVLYVCHQAE